MSHPGHRLHRPQRYKCRQNKPQMASTWEARPQGRLGNIDSTSTRYKVRSMITNSRPRSRQHFHKHHALERVNHLGVFHRHANKSPKASSGAIVATFGPASPASSVTKSGFDAHACAHLHEVGQFHLGFGSRNEPQRDLVLFLPDMLQARSREACAPTNQPSEHTLPDDSTSPTHERNVTRRE